MLYALIRSRIQNVITKWRKSETSTKLQRKPLVWLGRPGQESPLAFDFLRNAHSLDSRFLNIGPNVESPERSGLEALLHLCGDNTG
jgi:hypothetical protein